jgi:bifunctional DNA-binding transcriptional regulator/antitoxin component of YhaV-PrlF toxin-antitoxin module
MGYLVKMQKVERPTNQSFYLSFPSALAQALNIKKGESFEWIVENKNLVLLQRLKEATPVKLKHLP